MQKMIHCSLLLFHTVEKIETVVETRIVEDQIRPLHPLLIMPVVKISQATNRNDSHDLKMVAAKKPHINAQREITIVMIKKN